MDEPAAALSPKTQMSLMAETDELVKADSQFLIATHSPILMSYPHAELLELNDSEIRKAAHKETDHYKIAKQFIDHPEQMPHYWLNE